MTTKPVLVAFFVSALLSSSGSGQTCGNVQRAPGCSQASKDGFIYNSQSRGVLVAKGTTYGLRAVFYDGFDYSISVCLDKAVAAGTGMQIVDSTSGEVLFDNATTKSFHFEFTCETTRALNIRVSLPGAVTPKNPDGVCVGVVIEQMPTPKAGS